MEKLALILLLAAALPAWGFDANGVALGASEAEVKKVFTEARCRPMEWKTDAADRRCDEAQARFGGAEVRITFFLRKDAVQAIDVRFDASELERVAQHLRAHYGPPDSEGRQVIERRGSRRELFKMRWKKAADQAVLTSQIGRRRVDLNIWRGDFDTEIYVFQ